MRFRRTLAVGGLATALAAGGAACQQSSAAHHDVDPVSDTQTLTGRARAMRLAQQLGRSIGVKDPDAIDFDRWHDYVPVGDYLFEYHPARDMLSVRMENGGAHLDGITPKELAALHRAARGENEPLVGGMFERGGAYSLLDEPRDALYFVHDYPVAGIGSGRLREGFEYLANLGATWQLRWGSRIAGIVHHFDDAEPVTGPVVWNDERRALDADVSRLTGRARADAVVRAYLAHRLVQHTGLGRADAAGRAFGEVPDVYDGGDYYLRYLPASDQLEAGVFVATTADLKRIQQAGVPADRLAAALDAGAPVPGDRATPARLGPAFTRPAPFPGGAAPAATAFVVQSPPGRPGTGPMLYLTQRWPAAELTPLGLHFAMEPLLDYGTVWRHRWLWRAARMTLRTEPVPDHPLVRTPEDYGVDPAAERLDAAPAGPDTRAT